MIQGSVLMATQVTCATLETAVTLERSQLNVQNALILVQILQ